jgi:basic membrane protein A
MLIGCLMTVGCAGTQQPAANAGAAAEKPAEQTPGEAAPAEEAKPEQKLKVAMVCSGSVNDGGWNASGYAGLLAIEEKYGAEVSYSEQVTADEIPTVLRTYGREGYDIIIAHSSEYDEQMSRVSKEFPNTKFVCVNGFSTGDNLYEVQFKYWELQYFVGLAAGLVSTKGKIANVAAFETEMVRMEMQAMQQGMEYANPNGTASVCFTSDWNDLTKAKEATFAQLADGADVILANVTSAAPVIMDACRERGAYCIGWGTDLEPANPDIIVVSAIYDIVQLYTITVDLLQSNTEERDLMLGMKDGAMHMTDLSAWVPQDKKDIFNKRLQEFMDGSFEIEVDNTL